MICEMYVCVSLFCVRVCMCVRVDLSLYHTHMYICSLSLSFFLCTFPCPTTMAAADAQATFTMQEMLELTLLHTRQLQALQVDFE